MFGYDTGSMSGALLQIKRPSGNEACPGLQSQALSVKEQEIVVSSVVLGALFSSCVAGLLSDAIGRRKVLLLGSIFLCTGCVLMCFARNMWMMVAARVVTGFGVGISSHTVPMYISECAPNSHRVRLCFFNDMMIVFGQVAAAIVSTIFFHLETPNGWRIILGLGALPAGLMFLGFFLQPESPRYLLSQNQSTNAREVLAVLRGANLDDPELNREFEEMSDKVKNECKASSEISFFRMFCVDPRVRRALLLGCGLQALQQWVGINTIMYYGATILSLSGPALDVRFVTCFTDENKRDVATTILFAAAQIVGVVASWLLVDRLGRRPLMLSSLACITVCLTVLGFLFHMETISQSAIVVFILLYSIGFGFGVSPVPWTVNAEIYPVSVRGQCISLSTSTNWLMNFMVSQSFLSWSLKFSTYTEDKRSHPDGIFWLYAGIAFAGMVNLWVLMPETKGVKLEDMGRLFVGPGEFHAE